MIKPTATGASRGVTYIKDLSGLSGAIEKALEFCDEFIVEEYLTGQEFSVGVIGHYLYAKALPVVEIKSKNQFFDYEAKYKPFCDRTHLKIKDKDCCCLDQLIL